MGNVSSVVGNSSCVLSGLFFRRTSDGVCVCVLCVGQEWLKLRVISLSLYLNRSVI